MPEPVAYVALLRAVNLGAHNKVAMGDLRELLGRLGFEDVRSLLQSGNLVFRAARQPAAKLEALLAAETGRALGVHTDYVVRTPREWRALIEANPYPDDARRDPGHLVVMCCTSAPRAELVKALEARHAGPERVAVRGRQVYIVYPEGIGHSRVTNAFLERALATRGTGRNWNTVQKLAALIGSA